MSKTTRLAAVIGATAITAGAAFATPTVTIKSVTQRWPWNNKVDITYTVGDAESLSDGAYYKVKFTTTIPGVGLPIVIDGSRDVIAKAVNGTHTVTWTNAPSGVRASDCSMVAALYSTTGDYMIVDLDTGAFAFEGLESGDTATATPTASNARYNSPLYKSDRMVLRRVPKWTSESAYEGGYPTGNDSEADETLKNTPKRWQTDADYFIGVFPCTQAQYLKLMDTNPSQSAEIGDFKPVDNVLQYHTSAVALRTNKNPADKLASNATSKSFFERLNALTGIDGCGFDLPTEVMWEIAARAGGDDYYWWGPSSDTASISTYCVKWQSNWYIVNTGTKTSNPWGLFDVIGNTYEWCRNSSADYSSDLGNATDAWSLSSTGQYRIMRGGPTAGTRDDNVNFRASKRWSQTGHTLGSGMKQVGFRVSWRYGQ